MRSKNTIDQTQNSLYKNGNLKQIVERDDKVLQKKKHPKQAHILK